MGFRYRKSIKLAPGVRMTLSKSGVSYSAGVRGARVTRTASGQLRGSTSIPGTGLGYSTALTAKPHQRGRATTPHPQSPQRRPTPGLLAPRAEKAMYKAVFKENWAAMQSVMADHPDYSALGCALLGMVKVRERDYDQAIRFLTTAFASGLDPAEHAFSQKYLNTGVSTEIAPGVSIDLPINRDAVALVLAELHQDRGEANEAIEVVEQLEPTTYAAVSLAELYGQVGRFGDVIEMTEGVANIDDATALLCTFRGAAFRELGHFVAAREILKEALKSKNRQAVVRHRALLERAKVYIAEGKRSQARKDVERILAEDSDYDGLQELLTELDGTTPR
jgi:tetratricopeptide (TPR) repeat protein